MAKPLSSTEMKPLQFDLKVGEASQKTQAVGHKIGWLHTLSDTEGASFDITIKDSLGRIKLQRKNCSTQTKEFGELVNLETLMGEELEVTVDNVKGAEKIDVFLN